MDTTRHEVRVSLKVSRIILNLSQEQIALKTKMSQQRFSQIERGIKEPTEEEKKEIAKALFRSADSIEW